MTLPFSDDIALIGFPIVAYLLLYLDLRLLIRKQFEALTKICNKLEIQ